MSKPSHAMPCHATQPRHDVIARQQKAKDALFFTLKSAFIFELL